MEARLNELNASLTALYDSKTTTAIGRRKYPPCTRRLLLGRADMGARPPRSESVDSNNRRRQRYRRANNQAQFKKLIRDVLLQIRALVSPGFIISIDALDECNACDAVQGTGNAHLYGRDLPIKIFVTSRPEPGSTNTTLWSSFMTSGKKLAPAVQADELASTSLSEEQLV